MAKVKGAIEIDIEGCKGCELCVGSCPTNVILMSHEVNAKGYHYATWKIKMTAQDAKTAELYALMVLLQFTELKQNKQQNNG